MQRPLSVLFGLKPASLAYFSFCVSGSLVELMGVAMGNETTVASRENFTDLARRLYVMPGHFVVYRIGLTSGARRASFTPQCL